MENLVSHGIYASLNSTIDVTTFIDHHADMRAQMALLSHFYKNAYFFLYGSISPSPAVPFDKFKRVHAALYIIRLLIYLFPFDLRSQTSGRTK